MAQAGTAPAGTAPADPADRGANQAAKQPLFRQEALAQLGGNPWGERLPLAAPSGRLLTALLVLTVVLVLGFLATGTYPRKTTVAGFLEPLAGTTPILAPAAGTLVTLAVANGDLVAAGDLLLALDQRVHLADGSELAGSTLVNLAEQLQALQLGRLAAADQAKLEQQRLQQHQQGAQGALAAARRSRQLAAERLQLAQLDRARTDALVASGALAARDQHLAREQELARTQDLAAAEQAEQAAAVALAQAGIALQLWPAGERRRQAAERSTERQLQQQLAEAKARQGRVLRAPVAGRVSGLLVHAGDTLVPGQQLLHLQPDQGELQAVLWVPARDAGFVSAGQHARLRYDAFPHQRFGAFAGTVSQVEQVVRLPTEQRGPVQLAEAAFRVRVNLAAQGVQAYGQELALRPGMTLQADVVAERRTLLEWLLDPLRSLSGRL